MRQEDFSKKVVESIFHFRMPILVGFFVFTVIMLFSASRLKVDAGFEKNIPLQHEYMQTYMKHQVQFGGANRVLVSIHDGKGDLFNPSFFRVLEFVTDELSFVRGVEKSAMSSLYTPNTRYIEVTEDGFEGGPVVPADFSLTDEGLQDVRANVLKAGIVGRLVSKDFRSAMVSASLLEIDPRTDEKLDYIAVADRLERIRSICQNQDDIEAYVLVDKSAEPERFQYEVERLKSARADCQERGVSLHIIGFAKMIGDISDGAENVLTFFVLAIFITGILVYLYSKSIQLTIWPLICSFIAVIWQLGLLTALGFGIDPMSILVPFLIFAIGVSHGVQMVNSVSREVASGATAYDAAKAACARLLIPGGVALVSDTLGFSTLLLIEIDIIKELAVTASIGVAVIILTNLLLLPILLSFAKVQSEYAHKMMESHQHQDRIWKKLSIFGEKKVAVFVILGAILLAYLGYEQGKNMKVGDLHEGAPALRQDAQYNLDTAQIVDNYSIGVDVLSVIVETEPEACTEFEIMNAIDQFQWSIENVEGVQSAISLATVAKLYNAAYNEGTLQWRVLSRNPQVLSQATSRIPTSSGLLSSDCSVMPVMIFLEDHKAETIDRVVNAVKAYREEHPNDRLEFKLATGIAGVMAATNEEVSASLRPMLVWVYSAVILLCLISFRSVKATICVIVPLAVVSILAEAVMSLLGIGLTTATLPVFALGVGVGVDYGIYIFSRMTTFIRDENQKVSTAYFNTLRLTGNAVIFTGITLAIGVSTWIFSALQFQADMGILLTFMFLVNMIGAIVLLPALAAILFRHH